MKKKTEKYPECFGNLQKVFPMGKDGLRHTPEDCFACLQKTQCLRSAIQSKDGLKVKEEHLDRAYNSGTIGFMERWSKKKDYHRRKKSKSD
jgi:hypothetical protein